MSPYSDSVKGTAGLEQYGECKSWSLQCCGTQGDVLRLHDAVALTQEGAAAVAASPDAGAAPRQPRAPAGAAPALLRVAAVEKELARMGSRVAGLETSLVEVRVALG